VTTTDAAVAFEEPVDEAKRELGVDAAPHGFGAFMK
jgi:hypothetical protein